MRRLEGFVVSCIVVLSAAADLGANPAWKQSPMPQQRAGHDVQDLIDAYVISKMQDALQIDDEQFAKMVVAQKKLSEHRRNYRQERTRTLQELRKLLGQSEVLDDEIAVLTDPDPEAFARGIDTIVSDHERARALGDNARRRSDEEYSYERYLDRTRRLLDFVSENLARPMPRENPAPTE